VSRQPAYGGSPGDNDIRCIDLCFRPQGRPVLEHLNLQVPAGGITAVLGPPGAGKSALLHLLAGYETPHAGLVLIAGRAQLPVQERGMAYIGPACPPLPGVSVRDNCAQALRRLNLAESAVESRVQWALSHLKLEGPADEPADSLENWQVQRLALARALVLSPAFLLLDDPYSSLPDRVQRKVKRSLERLNRNLGVTLVYAARRPDRITELAAHVTELLGRPASDAAEQGPSKAAVPGSGPSSDRAGGTGVTATQAACLAICLTELCRTSDERDVGADRR